MNFIDKINRLLSQVVSFLVLILILELVYDTVMRYIFNVAVEWSFDISYMLYGLIFMLSLPYVDYLNRHVRIEILYNRLSNRGRLITDIIGYVLIYIPVSISLVVYGWKFFYNSYMLKETSSVSMWSPPIYPFKFVIPLTGVLLLLQTISNILRRILELTNSGDK